MKGKELRVFDGHNDTLLDLFLPDNRQGRSFFERSEVGQLDLLRAMEGGFGGGFFSVFVPSETTPGRSAKDDLVRTPRGYEWPMAPPVGFARAQQVTTALVAGLCRLQRQSAGRVEVIRDTTQLEVCWAEEKIAAVLHLEGAEAIDPELDALYVLHAAGMRSLGIAWSRPNAFGTGVPFRFPSGPDTGPGLSERGRALVHTCNELGIVIDLAHLNEQGFWDVARLSTAPLVVSHTAAHALCPSSRNLTDKQLDAVAASGGIVGVFFSVSHLWPDGRLDDLETPLAQIVDHVDYVARRIGVDHVALGSDFDGTTVPNEIKDASGLPRLIRALGELGYDESTLRKVAYENWFRLLRSTWGE